MLVVILATIYSFIKNGEKVYIHEANLEADRTYTLEFSNGSVVPREDVEFLTEGTDYVLMEKSFEQKVSGTVIDDSTISIIKNGTQVIYKLEGSGEKEQQNSKKKASSKEDELVKRESDLDKKEKELKSYEEKLKQKAKEVLEKESKISEQESEKQKEDKQESEEQKQEEQKSGADLDKEDS